MAKDRKLKAALDRYKGVDHKLEHQKKQQKQAEKKRKPKREEEEDIDDEVAIDIVGSDADEDTEERIRVEVAEQLKREELAADAAEELENVDGEIEGWETDESEDAEDGGDGGVDLNGLEDESESDSEDEDVQPNGNGLNDNAPEDEEADDDIPLSDIESLASEDKGDIIPHQRLTINNTTALLRSLKSFALSSSLPFSTTQSVTSTEPVEIKDPEDDLTRELAFYKQSLDAVKEGREKLKKEGVAFARPADYFAEMVKSEEQMGKVRQKMLDEAARKKASADARRQRDLKKFGKAVQVAKLQERDRAKRETLEKINVLKRSKLMSLGFAVGPWLTHL